MRRSERIQARQGVPLRSPSQGIPIQGSSSEVPTQGSGIPVPCPKQGVPHPGPKITSSTAAHPPRALCSITRAAAVGAAGSARSNQVIRGQGARQPCGPASGSLATSPGPRGRLSGAPLGSGAKLSVSRPICEPPRSQVTPPKAPIPKRQDMRPTTQRPHKPPHPQPSPPVPQPPPRVAPPTLYEAVCANPPPSPIGSPRRTPPMSPSLPSTSRAQATAKKGCCQNECPCSVGKRCTCHGWACKICGRCPEWCWWVGEQGVQKCQLNQRKKAPTTAQSKVLPPSPSRVQLSTGKTFSAVTNNRKTLCSMTGATAKAKPPGSTPASSKSTKRSLFCICIRCDRSKAIKKRCIERG